MVLYIFIHSALTCLVYLKPVINSLKVDNQPKEDQCLTEAEWKIVETVIDILKPFKSSQQHLEGEKYVNISYIPLVIVSIEKKLKKYLESGNVNDNVKRLVSNSLVDCFYLCWGEYSKLKFNKSVQYGTKIVKLDSSHHPYCNSTWSKISNLCCNDRSDKQAV